MGREDNIWLQLPKYSEDYITGVKLFIDNAYAKYADGDQLKCPCKKCYHVNWLSRDDLYDHLIWHGPNPLLCDWIYQVAGEKISRDVDEVNHTSDIGFGDDLNTMLNNTFRHLGDEREEIEGGVRFGDNVEVKRFYKLLEDGKQPLYPGCEKFSKLKFIISLYLWKCTHGITEAAFSELLSLIREVFPHADVPKSFHDAKCIIKDLGLYYKKIHACPNDCMLYWGENENDSACKVCGTSRWKVEDDKGARTKRRGKKNLTTFLQK